MTIKEIIFYNTNNLISDIYFSHEIIKNFCKINQNYIIKFYCNNNWFIYKDIPNLILLNNNDISDDLYNNLYKIIDDKLYINTQIYVVSVDGECNFLKLHNYFNNIIKIINYKFNLKLKYDYDNSIISLPYVNIDNFLSFKKSKKNKFIFYYNYEPTFQSLLFDNINDHNELIINLSINNPDSIIIIPNMNNIIKNRFDNIIDAKSFIDCIQSESYEYLINLINIASLCDIVISFDNAEGLYIVNNNFPKIFNGKWIHIGIFNDIFNKICENFENSNNTTILKKLFYHKATNINEIDNILVNFL